MKMFNLYFIMVISTPLLAMNSGNESAEEVQRILIQFKKKEPELLKEYSEATKAHQRTPSPETARRVEKAQKAIDSPTSEIRKRLIFPCSEHFNPTKIDPDTFVNIAPYIVKKKDS